MTEWKDCKISDIGTVVGGATPSTKVVENYDGGIIPWITPKDLSNFGGRYISKGERNITQRGLDSCSAQMMPKNTVLFSSRAPIGYIAIANQPICTNQGFKSVVPNEKIDPLFLYYLLQYNKERIESMGSGTTFKEVSGNVMKNIPIKIPVSKQEQQKIASVLGLLDDKIELNNAINDNLEEQARSIFQSWFIDYEPFGGSMPPNWHPSTLGQIVIMKTDSWSPAKNPNVVVEHYSIPAFDEKHYPVFEISSGIKSNKYLITPESVMISKLNPDTKRIWRPMCLSEHPVCSTEFIVYEAKKSGQRDYIYSLIDSVPFFNHLCSHTTGSTNSRQRATPKSTLDFALYLPPDSVIEDFCQIVTPMYDLIAANTVENQSLAKTRDSLLPRLMSGKLDISGLDL